MPVPESIKAKMRTQRALPNRATRRALREGAGLTQSDIALWLGTLGYPVTRESVARWESGERTPRGDLVVAYVEILDQLRNEQL